MTINGRHKMHQLIILGNGFDLACGLRSSFSQFYSARTNGTNSVASIPKDGQNVWDIILGEVSKEDPLWCDIEGLIATWVYGEHGKSSKVYRLYHPGAVAINISDEDSIRRTFCPKGDVYSFALANLNKAELSQEELTGFLLSQLKDYESCFAAYLLDQVRDASGIYEENAQRYFAAIRDACVGGRNCESLSCSILNFNYTVPFGADDYRLGLDDVRNVHGIIDATETIFGIDGKDVEEDSSALPFTKTFRLLALETGQRRNLLIRGEHPTGYIKVFGHSLAPADYSYFQAIFDGANLYSSDVVLVFLYKVYPNEPDGSSNENAIREDLYRRIAHLLIEYGAMLDNKDHGKNLMHKLLLEQRLIIKKIDSPSVLPGNIYIRSKVAGA